MSLMDWLAIAALFGAIFPLILMCIGYAYINHKSKDADQENSDS